MGVLNEFEYRMLGLLLFFEFGVMLVDWEAEASVMELVTLDVSPTGNVLLMTANEALRIALLAVGGV